MSGKTVTKILLKDWLQQYQNMQERKGKTGISAIKELRKVLIEYGGEHVRLANINKDFCKGFIDYMCNVYRTKQGKPLKAVSAANYCTHFACALNAAKREDLIMGNPFEMLDRTDKIRIPESPRVYLTMEELKTLINTECKIQEIKQAFLFTCFCGLRVSDLNGLTWGNIIETEGKTQINITLRKTARVLGIPLSYAAKKYLPQRRGATDTSKVFNLPGRETIRICLKEWTKMAGITKHVTMHTGRHTFATLLLTKDVNIKVVQELLGHASIASTQIYAKVIDKKREEAVNQLNSLFIDKQQIFRTFAKVYPMFYNDSRICFLLIMDGDGKNCEFLTEICKKLVS